MGAALMAGFLMLSVYCIEAKHRRLACIRAQKADRHVNSTLENLRAECLPEKGAAVRSPQAKPVQPSFPPGATTICELISSAHARASVPSQLQKIQRPRRGPA